VLARTLIMKALLGLQWTPPLARWSVPVCSPDVGDLGLALPQTIGEDRSPLRRCTWLVWVGGHFQ
jgi:hypothetical protein